MDLRGEIGHAVAWVPGACDVGACDVGAWCLPGACLVPGAWCLVPVTWVQGTRGGEGGTSFPNQALDMNHAGVAAFPLHSLSLF